jgi:hypothetical protein
MGERQKDDGGHGRRRVSGRPGEATEPPVFGPHGTGRPDTGSVGPHTVEALLGAALRVDRVDAEAEQRAVAAFRAARDAGTHRARTRRRDDWRPRERRAPRSLRTTLSVLLASLTLGGAAFAAIGTSQPASGGTDDRVRPHPSTSGSARPDGSPSPGSRATAVPSDRPATAKNLLAHCRAYDKVGGDGDALQATAWRRLVAAAGGETKVTAYCAQRLKDAAAADKNTGKPARKQPEANGGTGNNQNERPPGADRPTDKAGKTGEDDQSGQGDQSGTTGRTGTTGQSGQGADQAGPHADTAKEKN